MSQSYCNLIYHLVFSTSERRPWLDADVCARLYPFLGGGIHDEGGIPLEIGGTEDHVHILVKLRQDRALSDVLRNLKAKSSGWIHDTFPRLSDFAWQSGYGAFTVSESQWKKAQQYIRRQPEHHRKQTIQEEFVALLKAHAISYDERYIWK
jgi:REP-associated tyrosine transposase